MNLYDIVEVIADREEYENQGIVKGMRGRVIDIIQERPGVESDLFYQSANIAKINDLLYCGIRLEKRR